MLRTDTQNHRHTYTETWWRKKRRHPISLQLFRKLHDRIAWKIGELLLRWCSQGSQGGQSLFESHIQKFIRIIVF